MKSGCKKYFRLIIMFLILCLIYIKVYNIANKNEDKLTDSFNSIKVDNIVDTISQGIKIVYFGISNNDLCTRTEKILVKASKIYGFEVYYLNYDNITVADRYYMIINIDNNDYLRHNIGSIPMVMITNEGKVQDVYVGVSNYSKFTEFLRRNEIGSNISG